MTQDTITIPLPLITLNEYIRMNRGNKYSGAKMKKQVTEICALYTRKAMHEGFAITELPVDLQFDWYVKDKRSDKDNIAFQRKFIFDGIQDAGLIPNDNWAHIGNWIDIFHIDKENPRVEIRQTELVKNKNRSWENGTHWVQTHQDHTENGKTESCIRRR